MMCQVLGWQCYAGTCLTTSFLNRITPDFEHLPISVVCPISVGSVHTTL